MATTDTIESSVSRHAEGLRVTFSWPDGGYSLDDLDALEQAIAFVRRQMLADDPPL